MEISHRRNYQRFTSGRTHCVTLDFHYASPNFYTARAYELQKQLNDHGNRIKLEDSFYGDIAYRQLGKQSDELNHKDAYELINLLFPELAGKGLKAEGYARYTQEEVSPALAQLGMAQPLLPPAPVPGTPTRKEGSRGLKKGQKKG